jgi:hypothetical protein
MAQINFLTESDHRDGVWPALVNMYQEQGYEAGYARGVSDVLAASLEAAEDFLRRQPRSDPDARRLLYAFTEFLETRVRTETPDADHRFFIDGLGI